MKTKEKNSFYEQHAGMITDRIVGYLISKFGHENWDYLHYEVKGNIEDNWENFFDYIHRNIKCKNAKCKTVLGYCDLYTTTEGGKMMAQLSNLAYLYPLKGNIKVQSGSNKEGINISKTIGSIVEHAKTAADIQKIIQEKISLAGRDSVQPYIIAVNGIDINKSTAYVVVIDKHLFSIKSGKEAIDFCFKMFHVFHAKYPVASRHL
ncbi:hypothetical protein HCN44_010333 [Aphidius gifuensis]|uniref:Uncharacterized protein n=1 Tax=Aphidius gifuensis TaxID=684658 RepID=A0A835CTW9_APHGI|nr:hypothetical protein HCN44_010333 [Aphidius gifuensis]